MIWESEPWKRQLRRAARRLRRVRRRRRSTERALAVVEREVFVGCYVVRKLFDTLKVSDLTKALVCEVTCYANIEPVTDFNWHRLDQLYDLDNGVTRSLGVRELCNQVIHSFVFMVGGDGSGIDGVWLSSDRKRDEEVLFVPLEVLIEVFQMVGGDHPSMVVWKRDRDTGEVAKSAS
ncbi:MAG: hypothetical protein OXC84_10250 [Gammaproteobacteria bacterium]|nr:hypothetical protein [Gammaproteobacteria bacterium]